MHALGVQAGDPLPPEVSGVVAAAVETIDQRQHIRTRIIMAGTADSRRAM